jgi:KDO2-lipid IV(A) lauroyltransferase
VRTVAGLLTAGGLLVADLLLGTVPLPVALAVADRAGDLWFLLDRRRRRRARASLAVAEAAGLDVGDRDALLRRTFRSLMRVPVEVFLFPRHFRRAHWVRRRCRYVGDWARLRDEMTRGTAGVVLGGHLGNWELAAWNLRFLPVPARVVVRPLDNAALERRITRDRGGPDGVIAKRGAVRAMLRALREGEWVAVLADQDAGRGGAFVPFFGLVASTHPAPAAIALRAGAPVYVGACLRSPRGPLHFDLHLRRIPDVRPGMPRDAAAVWILEQTHEVLEAWIRQVPEQYNWIHRRWKTRPPGEARGERLPSYARAFVES